MKLLLPLALLTAALGCHAQPPAGTVPGALSPDLYRRVEILVRSRAKIPPDYTIKIGPRVHSDIPGFDQIEVVFMADGQTSKPVNFLLSTDNKTLAQLSKYDLSRDPKTLVSAAGRPGRGGSTAAPVQIVGFDDLECPFCAKMHAALFPALTARYGDKVRIVYRDFPISQHPWAMRAAVDVNCLAAQSPEAYWSAIDSIHAQAAELGGPEHSLGKANDTLDHLALEAARKASLKQPELEACIKKQDETDIKASMKVGEDLGVEATPILYINGEKLEGAYPLADVFRMVDSALLAEGQTPPPPYVPPVALPSSPTPPTPVAAPLKPTPRPGN